jgi:hypothetical protein
MNIRVTHAKRSLICCVLLRKQILQLHVYIVRAMIQSGCFLHFSHMPLEEAFRLHHIHLPGVVVVDAVAVLADPVITDLDRNLISAHEKR